MTIVLNMKILYIVMTVTINLSIFIKIIKLTFYILQEECVIVVILMHYIIFAQNIVDLLKTKKK